MHTHKRAHKKAHVHVQFSDDNFAFHKHIRMTQEIKPNLNTRPRLGLAPAARLALEPPGDLLQFLELFLHKPSAIDLVA